MTKKLNWLKKGQIFNLQNYPEWGNTHGQVPYYIKIGNKRKIFFTSRPNKNDDGTYVSHIHSLEIGSSETGFEILQIQQKPLLRLGEIGHFDEFGTMPCSVVNHPTKNEVWMYYVGWSRKFSTPYECAIGLAISHDGGETFTKSTVGPIVAANQFDPFVLGCPRVIVINGKWLMFYLTGIKWLDFNGRKECFYKLKMATSYDGVEWIRNEKFIIPERYADECQTCASVFYANGKYHMYFTYRHSIDFRNPERGYRIGYAFSNDLETWERNDEIGNFTVSTEGWDSEMVCYPNVNYIDGKQIMFYCGNNFGLNGFGYAELASE